ncbi:hypothetical protein BH20GEM1_BH20GEM1_09670 [soil metagenome]
MENGFSSKISVKVQNAYPSTKPFASMIVLVTKAAA